EAALVDAAVGGPVEGQAHVLELDDGIDRLAAHDLGGVLVDEVVAALDRVEGVPLPGVLLDVGQGGAHPALGGTGVGPGGVELGDDGGGRSLGGLERGPQAASPGSHDHAAELVVGDGHPYLGPTVSAPGSPG